MIPVAAELICSWRELNERNNKWTGSRQQVTRQQQQFRNRYRSEGPFQRAAAAPAPCRGFHFPTSTAWQLFYLSICLARSIIYQYLNQFFVSAGIGLIADPKFVGQRRVPKSLSGLALRHQNTHTHWRTHTHRETCIHINVVMSI